MSETKMKDANAIKMRDVAADGMVSMDRPVGVIREKGVFHVECVGADGKIKWAEDVENALTNEGQQYILTAAFNATGAVSPSYIRLLNTGATPGLSSTLASKGGTEASGTGYSPASVTYTVSKPATNYQAASSTASWTNSSGSAWTAVTHLFVATTSNDTGKFVAYAALSVSRTLQNGDTLNTTYTATLS
jgi:hypothetical protein